jgi:UDP-GlcNAc3NAcA epimerase
VRIVSIIGARPQFIKASVVSAGIIARSGIEEIVVHTGQHFDSNMSAVFFSELGMTEPGYQLDIHGGSHGSMTGRMLMEIEKICMIERPDAVMVYGDTNSTLAGALAAAKLHIPVAHVEAGLRSFNMRMPEEINRILTDRVSHWLFAPTDEAASNLIREGVPDIRIHNVGDVMYDVALYHGSRISKHGSELLAKLELSPKEYVLVTVHRAENTDDEHRLKIIVDALVNISRNIPVLWPIHPRTRNVLERLGWLEMLETKIKLIEPAGYLEMTELEKCAGVIATDSGGVQKEAFFHQVPCVTLRDETEWVELVASGWNHIVPPTEVDSIVEKVLSVRGTMGSIVAPYGDGHASDKIISTLLSGNVL